MTIVITTCTTRKRIAVDGCLQASDLPRGETSFVAQEWGERLKRAPSVCRADLLYAGRSFRTSVLAAERTAGELLVVSAGLGLVRSDAQVPSYTCTVVDGLTDSVSARITRGFCKAEWWDELNKVSPHSVDLRSITDRDSGMILAALSGPYIEMVQRELETLPQYLKEKLRLFTRTPRERIPAQLQPYLMPYDDRLDGPDSPIRGTRSDFAARALLHFVDSIISSNDGRSASQHADAVERAVKNWAEPRVFSRRRLSDDEIRQLMRRHWLETNGSTTKLLRLFRDELDIACEQGRFASLAREIRSEVSHG